FLRAGQSLLTLRALVTPRRRFLFERWTVWKPGPSPGPKAPTNLFFHPTGNGSDSSRRASCGRYLLPAVFRRACATLRLVRARVGDRMTRFTLPLPMSRAYGRFPPPAASLRRLP